MTGDDVADDAVDRIVDKAVERADTGRDTFRAVSVDDRFRKTVRDDHAPNAALHAAIKAAAEDDDRIHSVNLMGSHAPGNRHKGEPRYHVDVDVRNDGMRHPVLGATVAGRMVDRGDVRIVDVAECSDDHLVVSLRPIETRVEPIDVPVDDIPDDVFEDRVPDRPPVEPIREWVEDREHLFDTAEDAETLAELIADAIAYSEGDDVGKTRPAEAAVRSYVERRLPDAAEDVDAAVIADLVENFVVSGSVWGENAVFEHDGGDE